MLSFDEVHGDYNMPSQLNLHPINKPSDFTFCDIPKRKYQNHLGFSPIWSKNLSSNCTGSSSATKTIVEGRKELMEMIENLPESWYELSLKDMVKEDSDGLGLEREDRVDHMKPKFKRKKIGPISRTVSFDTGVFLLKMFVPSSFGSKKRTVSRSTSIDGLMKKRDIDVVNKSNISSRSYTDDRCCNTVTKNRFEEGILKHGCWFKSTNQKWCMFF